MPTNFNFTDPTYLRTIYDGLLSGTLHKDNASSLPLGLVGIYEEALRPLNHVKERQKFQEFFSAWALLKKEVSIEFVASLLSWPEEQVSDYIARYSKWFNAPTSGKYVLYHERLRSFVLQKISYAHFSSCNEAIIKMGQEALEKRNGDEWEYYALEYLSAHLLIRAMEKGNADALKALSYNTAHWNRQIEISKGFEWSKRMLNDMMLWASKYNDEEVIECALNKVDLYHQEQNDAPRIVELVAQNDMDTALQRIEAFGGNDQEGLQRKFILYMLCLMELTLLNSKDKHFRKEAIALLLKDLEEQIPVNHQLISWGDFFSGKLMFKLSLELAELGHDYLMLFRRTSDWLLSWKGQSGWSPEPGKDLQLQVSVLLNILDLNSDRWMDGHFQLINFIIDSNQCDYLDDLLTKQKFYKGTFDSEIIEIANRLYAMGLEEKYKLICDKCFERLSEIEDPKYRLISEFGLCLRFPEHQGKAKVLELQLRASFAQYPTEQKLELAELLIKFYISNKQLTQVLELIDDLPNENGHALQGGLLGAIYHRDMFVVNLFYPLLKKDYKLESNAIGYLVKILEKINDPAEKLRLMNVIISGINRNGLTDEFGLTEQIVNINPNEVSYSENGSVAMILFKSKGRQSVLTFKKQIEDDYLGCLMLKELITALDREGLKDDVLFFWDILKQELSELKDANARATILSQMPELLMNYFDLDHVIGLVNGLDVAWKRNNARKEIIVKLFEQSRLNEAYRLFNQIDLDQNNYLSILIKTNNLNLVCGDFNSILNQIFIYLKRYNKIYTDEDGRFNFMREMVQIASVNVSGQIAGALKDSKKRDIVHLELVQKIIKSGKNEEALKLLSKMEKGERKEHALSEMAVEEYANDPNKTLFIIQNMDTNTFKLYTEARIVQKYFDINKKEEIISFSERILVDYKPAIESRNKYTNAALAMVFSALLKLGELQRARHIFSFIVHGKEEIKTSVRVRCFMKIYNYYNDSQNAEATNDELKNFIQELEDEASIKKTNQYIEDLIVELIKQGAIEKALNMYENITSSVDGATYYDLRSNKHSSEVRIVKALIEFAGESAAENFLNRFIATDIYTEVLSAYIMESIRLNGLDSLSRLSDKINECDLHSEISVCLGSKYAAENDLNTDIFQQIKSSMDFRFYNEFMVSFVGQVRMENLIRDKLIKILKMKISDPLVEALILQKYFIKGIFTDEIPLETIRRAEDVLRLKWALEMKEDIEM